MTFTERSLRCVQYAFDVEIAAPRARVWRALVHETDDWWLDEFRMVGPQSTVTLEACAGGEWAESLPDGASLLWYRVHLCRPEEALVAVGQLAPAFGGPATTMLELTLQGHGATTRLRVSDALSGAFGDDTPRQLEQGWRQLFTHGLKRHVEGGPRAE